MMDPRQAAPKGPNQAASGAPWQLRYKTGITQGPIMQRSALMDMLTRARQQVPAGLSPQAQAAANQWADQAWVDFGRRAAARNVEHGLQAAGWDVQGRTDLGQLAAQLYRARLGSTLPILNLLSLYS